MNLNKHDAQTEMEMNMTPMIDVVFLLIVFFMIITDLTQKELEDIELPVAVTCVHDKPDPKEFRPIINISAEGKMFFKRKLYFEPESNDYSEVEKLLGLFASSMKKKFDDMVGKELPDDPLLVRADMNTPFKYVQKVMFYCAQPNTQIWKIQLAAKETEEAKALRKAAEGN